jgi:hypothetical protein
MFNLKLVQAPPIVHYYLVGATMYSHDKRRHFTYHIVLHDYGFRSVVCCSLGSQSVRSSISSAPSNVDSVQSVPLEFRAVGVAQSLMCPANNIKLGNLQ